MDLIGNFIPNELSQIEIDEANPYLMSINGQILSKDKKILYMCYSKNQIITLEEGIEIIEPDAFTKCTEATTLNFPDSTTEIRTNSMTFSRKYKKYQVRKKCFLYRWWGI